MTSAAPLLWRRVTVCVLASLLFAPALTQSVEPTDGVSPATRVNSILARRGLGPDALSVIDNIVRHEAPPPPAAPPLVRELLARPLAAMEMAILFERAVPAALQRVANASPALAQGPDQTDSPVLLTDLLAVYLDELAVAQGILRRAVTGQPVDSRSILAQLNRGPLSVEQLRHVMDRVDIVILNRATLSFVDATVRFVEALRAAGPRLRFPDTAMRFDSVVGVVAIGTREDDVHGPDAAVIVDPGGNDTYERAPVADGRVSVIIDLGGEDHYRGSDLAVHGLSAIIDLSGNDRYTMSGPGLGAAIAGASVLLDFSGDDTYESGIIGQGVAALGLGAIIDMRGNDTYRLPAGGQGFGMAGGVGMLWDRGGNDHYIAAGLPDAFARGGGISNAQGAAFGFRTALAGGIGILRDDSGDDVYEAEMFAQGMGFYYGIGLLWDGGGNDRYRAIRYAQGNGVHEAVGVLRDESGNDSYELTVGVGQGMGLDLAVGALIDGAGNDRYRAPVLAQGTATANGFGILVDNGGADHWHIDAAQPAWGWAKWGRGLPTLGLLLYDPSRAVFTRGGESVAQPLHSAELGGPLGDRAVTHEPPGNPTCPKVEPAAANRALSFADALNAIAPGFGGGAADPAAYAEVQRRLTTELAASVAKLPRDRFNITWALGEALRCALSAATPDSATVINNGLEQVLRTEPASPFAGSIVTALHQRPPPVPQTQRMLQILDEHPNCGVRAAALSLHFITVTDDAARIGMAPLAQTALRSSCWRLQATARARLKRLGIAPDVSTVLPSFLRDGSAALRD